MQSTLTRHRLKLAARPDVARAVVGRDSALAAPFLGKVHLLCARAHEWAVHEAVALAGGAPIDRQRRDELARAARGEAINEAVLRMLLAWPVFNGEQPDFAQASRWVAISRSVGTDAECARRAFVEQVVFGLPLYQWTSDGLAFWISEGAIATSRAIRAVARLEAEAPITVSGLEVSAFARHGAHSAIGSLPALAARLAARVHDLALMLDGGVDYMASGHRVWTARGWLTHSCAIENGLIHAYAVNSPTEVHFGAEGAGLRAFESAASLKAIDRARMMAVAVGAFDPCVEHRIEEA